MGTKTPVVPPPHSHIRQIVQTALEEDLGFGDLTSSALLFPGMRAKAQIMAKEAMVVAGLAVV